MINVEKVKPTGVFTNYIYKAIPLAFDESMSYYETLCGLLAYLKDTILPVINNNADATIELQTKIIELENYVNNYFENLDVQEEINNKLDDMAEHGELTDIIAQYLQLAGVLAFNTLDDLEDAENIVNGSICVILGKNTYNDGKTSYYKIRNILNTDVVDGDNIIAITHNNQLVGEKILNHDVEDLKFKMNLITNKKVIIIGDSYANRTNSWADRFRTYTGLDDTNSIIKKVSGVGFYNTIDNVNFSTMVVDNIPFNANEITDIIVGGGYNDMGATYENLSNSFNTFVNTCKTNYPNANIYVGFIGWAKPPITNYQSIIGNLELVKDYYINLCGKYKNVHYLNNVEYSLHLITDIDESYFHPTSDGQEKIALNMVRAWQSGSTNVFNPQINITSSFTPENFITNVNGSIYSTISNDTSRIFTNNYIELTCDQLTSINLSQKFKIGTLLNGYVQGRSGNVTSATVSVLINTSNNGYFIIPGVLFIDEGNVYLKARVLNRTGNGWINDTLKYIQIDSINLICSSMLQY